jgi:hypothetical protein
MLREVSHRLKVLTDVSKSLEDLDTVKNDTVEINRELLMLWLNIIMFFRTQIYGMYVETTFSAREF